MSALVMQSKMELVRQLKNAHAQIGSVYTERNKVLSLCTAMALGLGFYAGIGLDKDGEPGWQHVVYIELPGGQISFHVPDSELSFFKHLTEFALPWDGHDTVEKFYRVLHPGFDWLRDEQATEVMEAV
jgi:hypothetical protein